MYVVRAVILMLTRMCSWDDGLYLHAALRKSFPLQLHIDSYNGPRFFTCSL